MLLLKELLIRITAGFLALTLFIILLSIPTLFIIVGVGLLLGFSLSWKAIFLCLVPISIPLDAGLHVLKPRMNSKLFGVLAGFIYFVVGYVIAFLLYGIYDVVYLLFGYTSDNNFIYLCGGFTSILFYFIHQKLKRAVDPIIYEKWEEISKKLSRTCVKRINIVIICLLIFLAPFIYLEAFGKKEIELSPLSLEVLAQIDEEFELVGEAKIANVHNPLHSYSKLENYIFEPGDEYIFFNVRNKAKLTSELLDNAKSIVIKCYKSCFPF